MKLIDLDLIEPAKDAGPLPSVTDYDIERIRKVGSIIEPVVVRNMHEMALVTGQTRYEIVANPVSWIIAQRLGWPTVPVEVIDLRSDLAKEYRKKSTRVQTDVISQTRKIQERLKSRPKPTISQLATEAGLTRTALQHRLRILTLSQDLQEYVRSGRLTIAHARRIATKDLTPSDQKALAHAVVQNKWSVRKLEERIERMRSGYLDTKKLEQTLSESLGCRVELKRSKVTINYENNLDVLDGILERLGVKASEI